jgi:hypothetical protein
VKLVTGVERMLGQDVSKCGDGIAIRKRLPSDAVAVNAVCNRSPGLSIVKERNPS